MIKLLLIYHICLTFRMISSRNFQSLLYLIHFILFDQLLYYHSSQQIQFFEKMKKDKIIFGFKAQHDAQGNE